MSDPRPKRIQRKRTKGWRAPPNTKYIGRPSKWANPYPVKQYGRERSLALFRSYLNTEMGQRLVQEAKKELHGYNLMCWCGEEEACHGDLWLEKIYEPGRT